MNLIFLPLPFPYYPGAGFFTKTKRICRSLTISRANTTIAAPSLVAVQAETAPWVLLRIACTDI